MRPTAPRGRRDQHGQRTQGTIGRGLVHRSQHAVVLTVLLALSACSSFDSADPVAAMTFEVNTTHVPVGSPVEATFSFAVLPEAVFEEDYWVFVHFLNDEGDLMWGADHAPPRPTSEWAPGDRVEYTRTILVPLYPYLGDADVHMGLYSLEEGTRLPLEGDDAGQRAYRVGQIRMLPQAENVRLRYPSGWHGLEYDATGIQWRWSEKVGVITFDNPRQEAVAYFHLGSPEWWDAEPRTLTLSIDDRVVDRVDIPAGDIVSKIPLSTTILGSNDVIDLRLEVDQTFVPAQRPDPSSIDTRELGVRLLGAYVMLQ